MPNSPAAIHESCFSVEQHTKYQSPLAVTASALTRGSASAAAVDAVATVVMWFWDAASESARSSDALVAEGSFATAVKFSLLGCRCCTANAMPCVACSSSPLATVTFSPASSTSIWPDRTAKYVLVSDSARTMNDVPRAYAVADEERISRESPCCNGLRISVSTSPWCTTRTRRFASGDFSNSCTSMLAPAASVVRQPSMYSI